MRWLVAILAVTMAGASASYLFLHISLLTFCASAVALIVLSKFLGEATEQFSHHVGEGVAGFLNVSLSNLAELIILFAAIRANLIELVQAGIVGSMIGNLLLVMGCSVYVGCRKWHTLEFNPHLGTIYINQFFLVAVVLLLPSLFDSRIPPDRQQAVSYFFAVILFVTYLYFYLIPAPLLEYPWRGSFYIVTKIRRLKKKNELPRSSGTVPFSIVSLRLILESDFNVVFQGRRFCYPER